MHCLKCLAGFAVGKVHLVNDPGCCAVHVSMRQTERLPSMVRWFRPLNPFCVSHLDRIVPGKLRLGLSVAGPEGMSSLVIVMLLPSSPRMLVSMAMPALPHSGAICRSHRTGAEPSSMARMAQDILDLPSCVPFCLQHDTLHFAHALYPVAGKF